MSCESGRKRVGMCAVRSGISNISTREAYLIGSTLGAITAGVFYAVEREKQKPSVLNFVGSKLFFTHTSLRHMLLRGLVKDPEKDEGVWRSNPEAPSYRREMAGMYLRAAEREISHFSFPDRVSLSRLLSLQKRALETLENVASSPEKYTPEQQQRMFRSARLALEGRNHGNLARLRNYAHATHGSLVKPTGKSLMLGGVAAATLTSGVLLIRHVARSQRKRRSQHRKSQYKLKSSQHRLRLQPKHRPRGIRIPLQLRINNLNKAER